MNSTKKIAVIILLLVLFAWMLPNNLSHPSELFKEKTVERIYFEFKPGGSPEYHSVLKDDTISLTDKSQILKVKNMINDLSYDLWAPKRADRDYSVYISLNTYHENKRHFKMNRIQGQYVFYFDSKFYRNDELAEYTLGLLNFKL